MNKIVSYWYKGNTCQAAGLISPEESEILTSSYDYDSIDVEEPDLDTPYEQLEKIKTRLKELRDQLIYTPPDPCELDGASLSPKEDTCFLTVRQLQLQQLRRSNCLLRCQLQSRMQHLHRARKQLLLVQDMRCQLSSQLEKMIAEINVLEEFKVSAQHQFGLCIERNEQIKTSKIDRQEFSERIHDMYFRRVGSMRALVPLDCHMELRYTLNIELILVRIFLNDVFANLTEEFKLYIQSMR